jgi:uncharacterized delta-60 repeat protein
MRLTSLILSALAGSSLILSCNASALDPSFNGSGVAQDYLDRGTSKADLFTDMAIAPGTGSIYSVGRVEFVAAGGPTFGVLFKRLANGSKDPLFSNGSSGASRVTFGAERQGGSSGLTAVAFDASNTGAVLAAGFNDLNNGKRCGVVYKVLDNAVMKGALDGGFGSFGVFTYCATNASAIEFSDLKVLADGRSLVTGNGVLTSGEKYGFALRLTAAGQLDTSFNAAGIAGSPGSIVFDIRPGKDDSALRIAVGTQAYYFAGNSVYSKQVDPLFGNDVDLWVARVTPAGAFDSSFNGNGRRVEAIDVPGSDKTDLLADLALDASGRVLLLGNVNPAHLIYNSNADIDPSRYLKSMGVVIRLTTSGARDISLYPNGMRTLSGGGSSLGCGSGDFCSYNEPAAVAATATGVRVVGRFVPQGNYGVAPLSQMTIESFSTDGMTGSGQMFSQWTRSEGASVSIQPDGKTVVGGLLRTTSLVSDVDFMLMRFQ